MKFPKDCKYIRAEIFDVDILVITTKKQLKEYIKLNKIPKKVLSADEWKCFNGRAVYAEIDDIPFFTFVIRERRLSTIVHESAHMADYVTRELGIKDDETKCYLAGFFTDGICNILNLKLIGING